MEYKFDSSNPLKNVNIMFVENLYRGILANFHQFLVAQVNMKLNIELSRCQVLKKGQFRDGISF